VYIGEKDAKPKQLCAFYMPQEAATNIASIELERLGAANKVIETYLEDKS
jgi:hypothetical protein